MFKPAFQTKDLKATAVQHMKSKISTAIFLIKLLQGQIWMCPQMQIQGLHELFTEDLTLLCFH